MTQQKAPAQPGKKTRGDGDAAFLFADKVGRADLKRINDSTINLVVKQKAGEKSKVYNVAALPDNVKTALAAAGLAARGKMYIANHCDKPEDVLATFDAFWAENSTGKFHTTKEGSPRGRAPSVPVEWYVDALREYFADIAKKGVKDAKGNAVKPMSDAQYKDYVNKLGSLEAADRKKQYVDPWMKRDLYRAKLEEIKRKNRKPEDKQAADEVISL